MGAQRNAYRMRVLGIALIMISLLGCVSALDESIEAGRTEMNEITPVPATELAEAIPPRHILARRHMRMRRPHVRHVFRRKAPVAAKYPKGWSADPRVREKHVKRNKAFEHFKLKNEQWHKSRMEHRAKSEKLRKNEKPIKEKKRKKALREKKAKERKIKKQGREKARKHGRGDEKTRKAAHREALRKKSGAEGKIKEKKGKETTVKENRAKEKSIKHRKKHLTKEQAKKSEKLSKLREKMHKYRLCAKRKAAEERKLKKAS